MGRLCDLIKSLGGDLIIFCDEGTSLLRCFRWGIPRFPFTRECADRETGHDTTTLLDTLLANGTSWSRGYDFILF